MQEVVAVEFDRGVVELVPRAQRVADGDFQEHASTLHHLILPRVGIVPSRRRNGSVWASRGLTITGHKYNILSFTKSQVTRCAMTPPPTHELRTRLVSRSGHDDDRFAARSGRKPPSFPTNRAEKVAACDRREADFDASQRRDCITEQELICMWSPPTMTIP